MKKNFYPGASAELQAYCEMADLMGRTAGQATEIVVHDLTDPLHSVVHVVNGSVTGRQIGQGLRHLVAEMLAAQSAETDWLPLWWYRHGEKLIRCSTKLIRSGEGKLIGALCVNEDVTEHLLGFAHLREKLPGLKDVSVPFPAQGRIIWDRNPGAAAQDEKASPSLRETVFRLIDSLAKEEQMTAGEVSREKRRRFVSLLNDREVFLVKGSVEYVAELIGVKKVTIYSDLDAVRRVAEDSTKKL